MGGRGRRRRDGQKQKLHDAVMHGLMHLHDDGSDRESMTVHSSSSLSDLAATSHMIYSFFFHCALKQMPRTQEVEGGRTMRQGESEE